MRAVLALSLLVACAPANIDGLQKRASFDFACPEEQLVIERIDDDTRGVTGCGHRATYIRRGGWIQNGSSP